MLEFCRWLKPQLWKPQILSIIKVLSVIYGSVVKAISKPKLASFAFFCFYMAFTSFLFLHQCYTQICDIFSYQFHRCAQDTVFYSVSNWNRFQVDIVLLNVCPIDMMCTVDDRWKKMDWNMEISISKRAYIADL